MTPVLLFLSALLTVTYCCDREITLSDSDTFLLENADYPSITNEKVKCLYTVTASNPESKITMSCNTDTLVIPGNKCK